MNKNRVVCIIESIGSGGAERQLTGLAVLLKQQGYETEVWYYVNNNFYLPYLQKYGVNACYLKDANSKYCRFFSLTRNLLNYRPDIVISYSASSSMIVCLLKKLGATFKLIVSERNTTQRIGMRERLIFYLYRWADYIIPNSFSQRNFINIHFPNLSCKIKVITNFVDTEYFVPGGAKKNNYPTRMVCVGRVFPQKNVLLFLNVVKLLKERNANVVIDWYGRVEGMYAEECVRKVKELQLDTYFSFKGAVTDIRDVYRKSCVLCLPSLFEGYPNVLCEAMSCGLPVLCSRVCDNPSIVKEGENGFLFNPNSVEEIANTVLNFLNLDEETKKDMGRRSREIALSLFSPNIFVDKYLEIIKN